VGILCMSSVRWVTSRSVFRWSKLESTNLGRWETCLKRGDEEGSMEGDVSRWNCKEEYWWVSEVRLRRRL
jgi:hypothetical protein